MMERWQNTDNFLYRVYPDGTEEQCHYAGISLLTVGAGTEAARRPCSYCGEAIPSGQSACPGCGHSEWSVVTKCEIRIEAQLPLGGRLLDLNSGSVLEVRRREWYGSDYSNSYFAPEYYKDMPEKHMTIIKLSQFSLLNTVIGKPVPLYSNDNSAMDLTMMWECEAEFVFGDRKKK